MRRIKQWLGLELPSKWEISAFECAMLALRGFIAALIMSHGFDKMYKYDMLSNVFPDPIGLGSHLTLILAIFTEFFLGLTLLLGLLTRWSAFGILVTMLVAAFVQHANDPFSKKEMAIIYALVFLFFTLAGGGRWSLDRWLKKKLR